MGGARILEVKDLISGYGETQILFGVNLAVEKGTITTLLGSNGAGKSTTLWTIMSVVKPWGGKIILEGNDITFLPTHKKVHLGIVLVPEGRRLWPDLTVEENLTLAAMIPRAKDKMHENLELVYNYFPRLKERRNQLAGTLSGGEQQMLAIARGLMLNPEILMLDEPSLGLAPKLVQEIAGIVKRLRDEEGKTIFLVEQNIHIALTIADYGYLLENGRVVLEGTPEELQANPKIKEAYLGL
ncbi:MAG: ABC transporter ATP-binding protein [Desulfurococcales archaeon]|nr:ABC transporter ATP-binding protein [Desulfurococcales archaeon]MCE4626098.1 ABC transporter ATP-binding protein [Desulfurococcales archaeon]